MSLLDRRVELKRLLRTALNGVVQRLVTKHKDNGVYSLVFYPSSGYRSIGVAYNTRSRLKKKLTGKRPALNRELLEMLKDHPDLLAQVPPDSDAGGYYEVNACEWAGIEGFPAVNDLINSGYDALYDDGVGNDEICRFFETMLTEVLLEVRSAGVFESDAFASDVLLGVQFPDSANIDVVKRVSKRVNSVTWHKKICAGYGK